MQTLRLVFELLYFLSGILIAAFAFIGLKQLTIAKENAKMSAKREAYRLAADQCSHYFLHIIPLQNKLNRLIKERGLKFFEKSDVKISGKEIKSFIKVTGNFPEEFEVVVTDLLAVINSMEGFSIFFTTGVGAESVAYSSVGQTFCSSVRELLPFIIVLGQGQHWPNLTQLFLLWNERIESRRLMLDKVKIEDQLKTIENRTINPMGT